MTTITESQWVNYFGFRRFPFDRPEAGNEEFARPDFLASCFVEPSGFERVFGQADSPVTSLLFAARGTGKTACRVMMDYYCQNGLARLNSPKSDEQNFVLSVPHIRLDNVRNIARQSAPNTPSPEILVEHHVVEIMRQTLPAFVDMIAKNTEFTNNLKNLSRSDFEDLSLFLIYYSAYLSSSQKEFIKDLGVDMPPLDNPMKGLVGQTSHHSRPSSWESILYQQRLEASPLFHLERWAKLMPLIGIKATYVLVDGVDEIMESAQDPSYAHYLIRPLLTHLRLMDETNYLALKYFLPSDMEQLVFSDPAFRQDRGFVVQRLGWHTEDLIKILRERLNVLRRSDFEIRDRTAAGFDTLCVPELRGEIEKNLAQNADGNPRYLMNLCAQMVTAHCAREVENQDDPFQLNRDDFIYAMEIVKFKYHSLTSILRGPRNEEERPSEHLEQEPAVYENGQTIDGKYEVRKLLPPGAAGQVYCVYDDVFERTCALKIYNKSAMSTDSFRNEARSLLKIDHPNIVQVYGWGILNQSGRFYLISEFVDGKELTKYTLPGNLLPIQKAIQVILELLSALEYLHPDSDRLNELRNKMRENEIDEKEYEEYSRLSEQGLFHRDIKPSNMVLSPNGLKLIDFNIAAKAITAGQTYAGTVGYMLPEIGMMRWSADGDLFATGIVLYELVTGYHPYPDRQPIADTLPANPLQYMSELDPELVNIMLRAVSCDPQVRYHSARRFKQDLLKVSEDQ